MTDLNPEHAEHMDNLINGGLMRKAVPDDVASALVEQGYARHAVGGLVPTETGYKAFMGRKK